VAIYALAYAPREFIFVLEVPSAALVPGDSLGLMCTKTVTAPLVDG
jgi:hypothetical protein